MKLKVTVTNIATDKIIKEDTYELKELLTHILNKLDNKVDDDYLGSWRIFSVEIVKN